MLKCPTKDNKIQSNLRGDNPNPINQSVELSALI